MAKRRHPLIPADRWDSVNRRYRRQLEHPWIVAMLFWLAVFVLMIIPIGVGILWAGGIPLKGPSASDWVGSEAKGRSSAFVVVCVLSVVVAVVAVWVGSKVRRDRDEVRRIDAGRIGQAAASD